MATIKELKEYYKIERNPTDNTYLVYDKNIHSGRRMVYKYLCSLRKIGNGFQIIGTSEKFIDIKIIISAINIYVESLEFDSEYYNPMLRNGLFEELIIIDYLGERGFKVRSGWNHDTIIFILEDKNIYLGNSDKVVLEIEGLGVSCNDISPNKVNIKFKTGLRSWIEDACERKVHEMIKTIDSLLKPYFIAESARNINHADDYKLEEFKATINKLDLNSFEKLTADYKNELKTKLQEIINVL